MNNWRQPLQARERDGCPVGVGLIGIGQMGAEIVATVGNMEGMRIAVAVDVSIERARAGFAAASRTDRIVETDDLAEAERAAADGASIVTTNYLIATRLSRVDAVIDATGITDMAARVSLDAIDHTKHIVMMSVECDVTIGPILRRMAENAGVVYSLAAGDEPAAIIELYRFATTVGFEVVSAGKGKNNPLNIYSTPDTEREKAEKRHMNPRMLCEFVDGSKTAIEMTAVSNATGLVPDIRGMHGAKSNVASLNSVFVPEKDGGVLSRKGVVDFAIGVHPGVFVVVTTDNELLREGLAQRDMGPGPYYTLYRPFHLTSIEVPITVCQAVLFNQTSGHPRSSLVSECIAVSKRAIAKGETLDGIGEYCYRGSIDHASVARDEKLIPLGMAKGMVATRDIPNDTPISYEMVEIVEESPLVNLRRLQDSVYGG
jgi:predicted homoserine dehydrogenase-like protein